jgi:hypothetical protein
MKIAIIGKGTSAIITALVCISRGHSVEIFYDPNTSHISVGESTTTQIGQLIYRVLDICIGDLVDAKIVSHKNGVKFINWGKGNCFRHHFESNIGAFHFESGDFNPFIHTFLENIGVKYHPVRVDNHYFDGTHVYIHNEKYDFMISCSGWVESDEYKKPFLETVNSAVLYTKDNIIDHTYTIHEATEDGWQFGLPFPEKGITKHGYLFNRNQISVEDALKKVNNENSKIITWDPKYAKKLIRNRYSSYNGNRLIFFEPLQALSLHYYYIFADLTCDFLDNVKYEKFMEINESYSKEVMNYQLSLYWHYSYGSIFNTQFWNNTIKQSKEYMNIIPHGNRDELLSKYYHDKKFRSSDFFNIGAFQYKDFQRIEYGMTGRYLDIIDEFSDVKE